ncbi:TonB-dependent Receptor Plug Domain [Granulicella rosea]|uniref:TonB-dependent Receptor Plug Domain n=1 Tax=Granulicella rosea TaxID=474952 RepID=A0A239LW36_9BACT|nr:TonB-dependent receptor [Granulicella rosea]SNT34585.1 TonB-dependent Receptor Plug Domain [Granulicella rosea]
MRPLRPILPLALLVAFSSHGFAQSVDTAGLEVDLHDASGAVVAGATLTLTQIDTHDKRTGVTDSHGRFRFPALHPGTYQVIAAKNGFAELHQANIVLNVGSTATVDLAMTVASADTVVQVTAQQPAIDPDNTTIGQTISEREIRDLPSDGRNFLDFATTVPGVTSTQTTGQNSGFSVNGQRSRSNSIMIDGVENNGAINGNVRLTLSQEAIAQFQVLTEQFPAEFGGAGGGFINVITKSGSDQYHGDVFYFNRNQFFANQNQFSAANPNIYNRNDFGGAFGGPIKLNRTYFYAATEYIGTVTSAASNFCHNGSLRASGATCTSTTYDSVNTTLATGALIGSPVRGLDFDAYIPQSSALSLSSVRIDHRIGNRDTLIGRVLYDQYIQGDSTDAGTIYDISTAAGTYTHTQNYFAEETHIFSPNLLNEAHVMVAPQRLKQQGKTAGPGANIDGIVYVGQTADFPVTLNEDHYEADDALSWTKRSHLFKFGYQLNYVRAHSYFPTAFAGQWNFYTVTHFNQNAPDIFTQSFGNPNTQLNDTLMGAYAQDSWKATSRLTLNYGVRYDVDLQPQGLNGNASDPIQANLSKGMPRDLNNFAPRVALAYSLDKRAKTVLRAGYGMFYDKNLLILARNTLESIETLTLNTATPVTATQQYKTGPYTSNTTYPTGVGRAPSISLADPGLRIPFTHQVDLGVDRALTSHMILSVTGVHVTGEKLLKEANTNLGPPVILTAANAASLGVATPTAQQIGRPYFANSDRVNANFNDINVTGPWGHSNYNGLRATLTQQAQHGLTFRFGWVWSHAEDDAADFLNGNYANNPYDPHAERASSNEDVRNRFTASLVYRIPYGGGRGLTHQLLGNWVISGLMTGGSGTPETITVGSDVNNDDATTDRPFINGAMVGRNSFRGGRQSNVNARAQKEIRTFRGERLSFSAEAFNLFNHNNYTDFNTVWGTGATPTSASYGQPDAASSARILQLGARYSF